MKYSIEKQPIDKLAVVKVEGRLDANSADILKAALKQAAAEGLSNLVIDMQAISYIDSSGLSALVSGFKAAREHNGLLALAYVGPQVKMALELTHLNRIFPIYENTETALDALAELGKG
ncbi:MAG: anti-sigma factor antagonist [Chloroflexi bacterium]|nr:MAG: anti-sigma factor antagonist [Chloroflexota bacterium]